MRNIAIIGTGSIASQHIESYLAFPERCRIVALCDIDRARTAARAEEYCLDDVKLYEDFHVMLEDPELELDLVSIAAPPFIHCEAAVAALAHGCHVLTEKPMAPSVEECDRMIAAAKKHNRQLSSVAQNRFDENYAHLQAAVTSGLAGRPLYMLVESVWWRGTAYYDMWWRGTWENEGGGVTLNVGVHQIDLLLWIMGMPEQVTSIAGNFAHENSEVEDLSLTMLRFPGGAAGSFNCSNIHHGEERTAMVQCEKAGLWSPWKVRANRADDNGFPLRNTPLEAQLNDLVDRMPKRAHPNLFFCQIENFLDALDGTAPLRSDAADGRNTIELVSAIYKSVCTGQPVSLPMDPADPFYRREGVLNSAPRYNRKDKTAEEA